MWKMFTVNNNTVYWDKIDKLVNDYNNSRHSSIKMTPVEASNSNLYGDSIYLKPGKSKFAIGVIVLEFLSIRGRYLIKVTHQTGQRRYL